MSCVLCHCVIEKSNERYLINGKGQLDVRSVILELPFTVNICSSHVCKSCFGKLKKRKSLQKQQEELLKDLEKLASSCLKRTEAPVSLTTVESVPGVKKQRVVFPTSSISPVRTTSFHANSSIPQLSPPSLSSAAQQLQRSTPTSFHFTSTPRKTPNTPRPSSTPAETSVTLKVQWPSETRERRLPKDLESLGKMLLRGTYKQVARAAWQNPELRKELQHLALKQIDKECNGLCSKKEPSCLRSPFKDDLLNFSFEKLNDELVKRAPFTNSILRAACVNRRNASKREEWVPTVGMAAAVLLRNRSTRLNAVQLMLSIFLYHSSWSVCII